MLFDADRKPLKSFMIDLGREPSLEEMDYILLWLMRGLNGQTFRQLGDKVRLGPFAGMRIPEAPFWEDGNSGAKLLGTYEHELHSVIEKAIAREPEIVLNVGSAEGYYAIGFARRLLNSQVVAWDLCRESLEMLGDYARLNGVSDRIQLKLGVNDARELSQGGPGKRLYLVDCEGGELPLLNLDLCPELNTADIIVECHDFFAIAQAVDSKILPSRILADRLALTHEVEIIGGRLPNLERFNQEVAVTCGSSIGPLLVLLEKRPMPTRWLACWARTH